MIQFRKVWFCESYHRSDKLSMNFSTLISVEGLAQFINEPDWVVVDCRFSLDDPARGHCAYLENHIPGAVFTHIVEDLSGPVVPGQTGRHPLPEVDRLVAKFGAWGIGSQTQVVVYDDSGGAMAARLWWLLRWLGHETVAVLDGGYPAWVAAGQPVNPEIATSPPVIFTPNIQSQMLATTEDILRDFGDPGCKLVDSRDPERYRGEVEPIDPVAGHIPGAVNYPFAANIDSRGHTQLKQILRGRFETLFGFVPAERVTFYCGSGITAAHNVLAVAHAGLGMTRLYAGSWSEWIADPERPIAIGE
jgi:thiosulfate/3-mercaptopyruvate sulfurtransferase